jgi:hypothetical protein
MDNTQLQAGDRVEYDIVIGKSTVKGQGRVTGVNKAGPLIQPNGMLPRGAKLENIQKVK